MSNRKPRIVVWDTEFTSWDGCIENGWDESKEQYKELIQISGLCLDLTTYEIVDTFDEIVRPRINEQLSAYIQDLTGITQDTINQSGVDAATAITRFEQWADDAPRLSWGDDSDILAYNIELYNLDYSLSNSHYFDIRPVFAARGVPVHSYNSGTLYQHFDVEAPIEQHYALDDARSLALSLQKLAETTSSVGSNPEE